MSIDLKPCPFCGNPPEVSASGDGTGIMIECMTEGCVNPHTSWYGKGIAHKHWNTRYESARTASPDNAGKVVEILIFAARVGLGFVENPSCVAIDIPTEDGMSRWNREGAAKLINEAINASSGERE